MRGARETMRARGAWDEALGWYQEAAARRTEAACPMLEQGTVLLGLHSGTHVLGSLIWCRPACE